MDCPGCDRKIGFFESLTIINPLNFKCKKCSNYMTLSRSSIRTYLILLIVIFVISLSGFYWMETDKILTKTFLQIIVPAILVSVTVIHYFFWNSATADLKNPDKNISGLSC